MQAANNSSPVSRLIPVLIVVAGLIGLYYLYRYLFGHSYGSSYTLISKSQPTSNSIAAIASSNLPVLYEGGEFTFSTWIYVNSWNNQYNKPILRIGGTAFDTIRVYLGAQSPTLNVDFTTNTSNPAQYVSSCMAPVGKLSNTNSNTPARGELMHTFGNIVTSVMSPCTLPQIDLQRWVHITVAVNGKTVDVYLDGKLSQSTVLPNFYKVDGGYNAYLLNKGIESVASQNLGVIGQISTTMMYDYAQNPEQVYKAYMAGPEPVTGIWQWITSTFAPNVSVSITTTR
jgi:hypothetical protein